MAGWRARSAALVALVALAVTAPVSAANNWSPDPVLGVRARPVPPVPPIVRPQPPPAGRKRCISVDRVAGAVVMGDRAVELSMATGARWRLFLAEDCPSLSFYQGFYYRRGRAGMLCAGRDAVISRAGGECGIASITPIKPVGRRRR